MKRSIVYSVYFLCILIAGRLSAATWEWQNPRPDGNMISHLAFADSANGWAVGGYGTILRTTDVGVTWTALPVRTTAHYASIVVVGGNHLWAVGQNYLTNEGIISHSTDGGSSWQSQQGGIWYQRSVLDVAFASDLTGWVVASGAIYGTTNGGQSWSPQYAGYANLYALDFVDAMNGWAVGYDWNGYYGVVLHTADGGQNWEMQNSGSLGMLQDVKFLNADTGWVVGLQGNILKTTDGGQTWDERIDDTVTPIHVCFTDPLHGWIGCAGGGILRTTDGGAEWTPIYTGTAFNVEDICFANPRWGWICGDGGVICRTGDGGDTWTRRGDGITAFLYGVDFVNPSEGWVAGSGGTILHTTNSGVSWEEQTSGTYYTLCDVGFTSDQEGWMVGGNGIILHTTNSGAEWQAQNSPVSSLLTRVAMADSRHGWAVSLGGTIVHTSNGGQSWQEQVDPLQFDLNALACSDSLHAWAVCIDTDSPPYPGYVIHTEDGGQNWQIEWSQSLAYALGMEMQDNANGWMVGVDAQLGQGIAWHTTDGGNSWSPFNTSMPVVLSAVHLSGEMGLIASQQGTILRTTDGGAEWYPDTCASDVTFWDIESAGPNQAWVVGEGGAILHSATANAVNPQVTLLPRAYSLSAYPNPFNPVSNIELNLPHEQRVKVAVYDLNGRIVANLADALLPAGTQRLTFDGSSLASGMYFVRAEAGSFVKTQRLLLVK